MLVLVALLLCLRLSRLCPGLVAGCCGMPSCSDTDPRHRAARPPQPRQASTHAAMNCVDAVCCRCSCHCCCVGTPWAPCAPCACAPYDACLPCCPWFCPCFCPCLASSPSCASWDWTTWSPRSCWTMVACCGLWVWCGLREFKVYASWAGRSQASASSCPTTPLPLPQAAALRSYCVACRLYLLTKAALTTRAFSGVAITRSTKTQSCFAAACNKNRACCCRPPPPSPPAADPPHLIPTSHTPYPTATPPTHTTESSRQCSSEECWWPWLRLCCSSPRWAFCAPRPLSLLPVWPPPRASA